MMKIVEKKNNILIFASIFIFLVMFLYLYNFVYNEKSTNLKHSYFIALKNLIIFQNQILTKQHISQNLIITYNKKYLESHAIHKNEWLESINTSKQKINQLISTVERHISPNTNLPFLIQSLNDIYLNLIEMHDAYLTITEETNIKNAEELEQRIADQFLTLNIEIQSILSAMLDLSEKIAYKNSDNVSLFTTTKVVIII